MTAAEARGYQNRSEIIRDLARAGLQQNAEDAAPSGQCVAALVYVYDHAARDLSKRLVQNFHGHHDLSLATLHVHLDDDSCMEVTAHLERVDVPNSLTSAHDAVDGSSAGTNDTADAEAICEAVTRSNMRFVATKTPEQQSCLMLHRTRHLFIRQQTAVINAIRAHLAEFGIVAPVGRDGIEELFDIVADSSDKRLPDIARTCLAALGAQLRMLKAQVLDFDRQITAWHRSSETSRRLDEIPGVGPMLATALVASVAEPNTFRSGRDFSAWIGLVPKQRSSGGKDRLGSISKQGDRYLRSLFVAGALAVIRYAKVHSAKHRPWLTALLGRRPTKVAAIALANKIARMAWAMMARGERYKQPVALAA